MTKININFVSITGLVAWTSFDSSESIKDVIIALRTRNSQTEPPLFRSDKKCCNFSDSNMCLMNKGFSLDPEKTLESYRIKDGATISVYICFKV